MRPCDSALSFQGFDLSHRSTDINKPVEFNKILLVEAANKLLQSQSIFDVLVTSACELKFREEKSLLSEQHIDNISGAYFIPCLGRGEC